MSNTKQKLPIRPYARLLTMLGDQLIKNEIVALTELVKNAYDADGTYCTIDFVGFAPDYVSTRDSKIIISDNGYGMSYDVITKHFLNPATPIKRTGNAYRQSKKGRVCQGEKGIGRFSMLKLGKKVTVYSKEETSDIVHQITFNFEAYDDEFLALAENESDIFLDELRVEYSELSLLDIPSKSSIAQEAHGTIIVIESLKGNWDSEKVGLLKADLIKFAPLEVNESDVVTNIDFSIRIFNNGIEDIFYQSTISDLRNVILDKALYRLNGSYNERQRSLSFAYVEANGAKRKISVRMGEQEAPKNEFEIKLWGLSYYKNEVAPFYSDGKTTICGDFGFEFYIFDFAANQADYYGLSKAEKDLVRNHRVFLYRDGVRVQPYGAPNDDWLQIDRKRATARANEMFSNDQLIGQIKITKKANENLKDKTSREGIIEDSKAFEQLTAIIRTLLSLVRTKLYQNYCSQKDKKKKIEEERRVGRVNENFARLEQILEGNAEARKQVALLQESVATQRLSYEKRLDTAESLAAVGLSVEAASHDIMLTMDRLKEKIREIKLDVNSPLTLQSRMQILIDNAEAAEEMFALVYMKMKDLQQIFVSSKQRPKQIRVETIVKKIEAIYAKQYAKHGILVEYKKLGKSPVVAKLIDAVLYQVFINLFDNALYWLQLVEGERKVQITFDGDKQTVIFSDNGYGIVDEDVPYIFDAFFSGKGEEGRGLGLYIAKKLLNRSKYTIELLTAKHEKLQCGANFQITFVTDETEA